jgi:hypothetical protein
MPHEQTDHLERLRAVARLGDLPAGLRLLLGTVSEAEERRLEALALSWPMDRWPPPVVEVRRCLDWSVG